MIKYSPEEESNIEQLADEYFNVFESMLGDDSESLNGEISVFKDLITTIVSELL